MAEKEWKPGNYLRLGPRDGVCSVAQSEQVPGNWITPTTSCDINHARTLGDSLGHTRCCGVADTLPREHPHRQDGDAGACLLYLPRRCHRHSTTGHLDRSVSLAWHRIGTLERAQRRTRLTVYWSTSPRSTSWPVGARASRPTGAGPRASGSIDARMKSHGDGDSLLSSEVDCVEPFRRQRRRDEHTSYQAYLSYACSG